MPANHKRFTVTAAGASFPIVARGFNEAATLARRDLGTRLQLGDEAVIEGPTGIRRHYVNRELVLASRYWGS